MARKFFYVCAGLFLLVCAFAMGASTASGQFVVDASDAGVSNTFSAVVGRTAYILEGGHTPAAIADIPGTARVIAVGDVSPSALGVGVVLENGDCYYHGDGFGGAAGTWNFQGNVFSGAPTPALHQSWGQVKARYHATPRITVTPGANDR